jgi:hypothetical protein
MDDSRMLHVPVILLQLRRKRKRFVNHIIALCILLYAGLANVPLLANKQSGDPNHRAKSTKLPDFERHLETWRPSHPQKNDNTSVRIEFLARMSAKAVVSTPRYLNLQLCRRAGEIRCRASGSRAKRHDRSKAIQRVGTLFCMGLMNVAYVSSPKESRERPTRAVLI